MMDQHCGVASLAPFCEELHEFSTPCDRKDSKKVVRKSFCRLGSAPDRFSFTWPARETASRKEGRIFVVVVVLLSLFTIAEAQVSCRKGWYATSSDCKRCPPGYSTLSANSTSVSNCTSCDAASALNEEGKCDNLERKELIELHESTNGEEWDRKWDVSDATAHHCDWYGVECDDESRVSELHLNNTKLIGMIPSFEHLTNLQSLGLGCDFEYFNQNKNRLTGTIPTYENIIHLEKLDLSCNQLTGTIPSFETLTNLRDLRLQRNQLTGDISSQFRKKCDNMICLIAPNLYMCFDGERLLGLTCTSCPFPDRCVPYTTNSTENHCKGGFTDILCMNCPESSFDNGNQCIECSDSLAGMSSAIALAACLLGLFSSLFLFYEYKLKRRLKLRANLKNLSMAKQIGAVSQLAMTITSFVKMPLPGWLMVFKTWLATLSDVIPTIKSPCVESLSALPKWQQGMLTFASTGVAVGILLFGAVRTDSKQLQTVAGFIVTQSVLVCLIASTDFVKLASSGSSLMVDNYGNNNGYGMDEGFKMGFDKVSELCGELASVMVLAKFYDMFFQMAARKVNAARRLVEKNKEGNSEIEGSSSLLPFWASFCSPYVSRSADFERAVMKRKYYSFLVPPLIYLVSTGVEQTIALTYNINKHVLPEFSDFSIPSVENYRGIALSAASLQSILFVGVQTWYMSHLVKRPYISTRSSSHYGDPMNSADMITTRALSYSAVLLSSVAAVDYFESEYVTAWSNCVAVFLLVFLVLPQYKLFRSLRLLLESAARGKMDEGEKEREMESRSRTNSAFESSTGATIDRMMETKFPTELFRLESELLNDPTLTDGEKLRWEIPKLETDEKAATSWRRVLRLAVVMFRFFAFLLLVFAGVLGVLGLLLLSAVKKWGVEWVLFGLAVASVIAQEVLRWKWEDREELEAQRYRYTQKSRARRSMNATTNPVVGTEDGDTYL